MQAGLSDDQTALWQLLIMYASLSVINDFEDVNIKITCPLSEILTQHSCYLEHPHLLARKLHKHQSLH